MTPTQIGNIIIFVIPMIIMVSDILIKSLILHNEIGKCIDDVRLMRVKKFRDTELVSNFIYSIIYFFVIIMSVNFFKLNTFVGYVYILASNMMYPLLFFISLFILNKLNQYNEFKKKIHAIFFVNGSTSCSI